MAMKKKLYIQPQMVELDVQLKAMCVDTGSAGEPGDGLPDEGMEDVRAERFKLENNVNALSGTNVWNNEW